MKKSNGLSTRMRNLMNAYVGRKFNYFHGGYQFYWSIKIVALMGETGFAHAERHAVSVKHQVYSSIVCCSVSFAIVSVLINTIHVFVVVAIE